MFNSSNIVIGSAGIIAVPLLDIETGQEPALRYGPNNSRYNFRLFARLPGKEDLSKLPCPMGYDREQPRFDVELIVAMGIVNPIVDVSLYELRTSQGKGSIPKRSLYQWDVDPNNRLWPALPVNAKLLMPGNTVEILGVSRASTRRVAGQRPTLPRGEMRATWNPVLRVKITWTPKVRRRRTQYVEGDPFSIGGATNPEDISEETESPGSEDHTFQPPW